ncbi:hypothetical protein A3K73_07100 [Candidatus Pacearchaeota archaeon RBG_13_36_9]|nr:MAG: hypothetical protein A3K73_07100 [Candidatus Pacearchaeota archaeon RBG_13_36_9]
MGLESLKWDNLVRIAEEARDSYINDKNPSGAGKCGEARRFIAEMLHTQLGSKLFDELVSSAFFRVKDHRGHFLIVVGGKKPDFKDTFRSGIKLDPTICQFRDLYPGLKREEIVFNGDYPEIYVPASLEEDPYFPTAVEAIRMEHKGYIIQ